MPMAVPAAVPGMLPAMPMARQSMAWQPLAPQLMAGEPMAGQLPVQPTVPHAYPLHPTAMGAQSVPPPFALGQCGMPPPSWCQLPGSGPTQQFFPPTATHALPAGISPYTTMPPPAARSPPALAGSPVRESSPQIDSQYESPEFIPGGGDTDIVTDLLGSGVGAFTPPTDYAALRKDFNPDPDIIPLGASWEPDDEEDEEASARKFLGPPSSPTNHSPTRYDAFGPVSPSTPSDHAAGAADHVEMSSGRQVDIMRLAVDAGVQEELDPENCQHMKVACEEASHMLANVSVDALSAAKAAKKTTSTLQHSIASADLPWAGETLFPTVGVAPLKHLALYRSCKEVDAAVALHAMVDGPFQAFQGRHGSKSRSYSCGHVADKWKFSGKNADVQFKSKVKWPTVSDYCRKMLDDTSPPTTCMR
jgi:hypothetical protein